MPLPKHLAKAKARTKPAYRPLIENLEDRNAPGNLLGGASELMPPALPASLATTATGQAYRSQLNALLSNIAQAKSRVTAVTRATATAANKSPQSAANLPAPNPSQTQVSLPTLNQNPTPTVANLNTLPLGNGNVKHRPGRRRGWLPGRLGSAAVPPR